jgi:hypothetical protein
MVDDTWQDAKSAYNRYAKKVGFSIKIGSSKKNNKQGDKDKVMFVCNKNGSNVDDNDGPVVKQRKRNKTVKTGCTARLTLKKRDHNHPVCTPLWSSSFAVGSALVISLLTAGTTIG